MSFLGLPKFLPIIGTLPLDLYSEYKCLNRLLVIPKNCAKSVCFDFPFWYCFNAHSSLLLFLSFTMNSSVWLERKFLWEKTLRELNSNQRRIPIDYHSDLSDEHTLICFSISPFYPPSSPPCTSHNPPSHPSYTSHTDYSSE